MSWNSILKSAFGIAALGVAVGAHAGSNGVKVTVAPEKAMLGASDDVVVNVTITNTSSTPQYVLKARTPFEGLSAPLFDITRDGARVAYTGALIKRGKPTQADYYLLKPGGTVDAAAAGGNGIGELQSEAASLYIQGRLPRGASSPIMEALKQGGGGTVGPAGLSYASCTASQQTTIASAISASKTMSDGSVNYMANTTMGPRYTKWFGTVTATRQSTVKSHYTAIQDAFYNKPVVVDCSCKQNYYAYVYPTQPYRIYVCKAFWTAPMTGTDSKGGTLVHEMSHFNVVAGTDDHVYGQSGAASLAISDPDAAVDNADSHEYFAENTPALN
jgi:peptidyl-Lys metalloendopeptidase